MEPEPTVHIAVGWNDEHETTFTNIETPGGTDGDSGAFEADVSKDLWDCAEGLYELWREAHKAVVEATGYDEVQHRMARPCSEWSGEENPGHTVPDWWEVVLPAAENFGTWPARPVTRGVFESEPHAHRAIAAASLAPQLLVVPIGGVVADLGQWVDPALLTVEERPGWTSPPSVSPCDRCGWKRDEHGDDGGGLFTGGII